jgi:Xaa-Pro aminopeptidase
MNQFLEERRARIAAALPLGDAILVVGAGQPIPLPEGSDQTYPFRSHAEYFYLTGQECAGGILAFDPRDGARGGWISFVPVVTESERIWEGREQLAGTPKTEFARWYAARSARRIVLFGAPQGAFTADHELTPLAREALTHARRVKDSHEIALIRRAVEASAAGYAVLRDHLRAGVTERELQIELEAGFFRAGATRTGYGSIVGSGPNSAVLHVSPSSRKLREGDFVLVDAGAEIDRYMADVTRTYVAGTPTAFQRDLYAVVLSAQVNAVSRCVAGVEWKDLHLKTATELVAGLVSMGVMRGSPESLVEKDAHALFYPHGLGHMVGLGVRDGSGMAPGRLKDPRPSLRTLRMDLPLKEGYMVTVEPGLYFIPPLLNDAANRQLYHREINWSLVDQHLQTGGVRIEDNVLVTSGAPEVLTQAIPKTLGA